MIRAFLIQPQPLHSNYSVYLWPFLHTNMGYSDRQVLTADFCCLTMPIKYSFIPSPVTNLSKLHPIGAFVSRAHESCNVHYNESRDDVGVTCHGSESAVTCSIKELKETQRRLRIGLANKGKVPWNKGKKHSAETCARIKERTLEALRDPKVRKRMSQNSRLHSEQSKRKIGSSLRKLWAKRLKLKRSKEMFYSSWAESIAEAARIGGVDEEELDWDSYERLKVEMVFQRLQWDKEKTKEKEMRWIQAEKKVLERKHTQNAELRDKKKKIQSCKTREDKGGLAASSDIKKKTHSCKTREDKGGQAASSDIMREDRLPKILEKKSIDGPSNAGVMLYLQSALEKFDIESIKAERRRNTVSLADQIQAAKNKRSQILTTNGSAMTTSSPRA